MGIPTTRTTFAVTLRLRMAHCALQAGGSVRTASREVAARMPITDHAGGVQPARRTDLKGRSGPRPLPVWVAGNFAFQAGKSV